MQMLIEQLNAIIWGEREKSVQLQNELLTQYERCAFLDSKVQSFDQTAQKVATLN